MKSLILVAALIASPFAMAQHEEHGAPAPAEATQATDKKAECEMKAEAAGKKGTPAFKKALKKCMHEKH